MGIRGLSWYRAAPGPSSRQAIAIATRSEGSTPGATHRQRPLATAGACAPAPQCRGPASVTSKDRKEMLGLDPQKHGAPARTISAQTTPDSAVRDPPRHSQLHPPWLPVTSQPASPRRAGADLCRALQEYIGRPNFPLSGPLLSGECRIRGPRREDQGFLSDAHEIDASRRQTNVSVPRTPNATRARPLGSCGGACKPGSHGRALAARLRRLQELSSPTTRGAQS